MNTLSILYAYIALCTVAICNSSIVYGQDVPSVWASLVPDLPPSKAKSGNAERADHSTDGKYHAMDIINKSITGILITRGYEATVHYAISKDGYYIHLVRIINPAFGKQSPQKRPVVFNHGLFENAAVWLLNSNGVKPQNKANKCETSPIDLEVAKNETEFLAGPLLLSNRGYDVWLMSMRGTDFSLYHKIWDTSAPDFWDYSLDNFALYDIPTVVNYVRRYTGHKKVAYVGHSQATFSVFALLAKRPQYANIIEPVFAVAPVVYMSRLTSLSKPSFLAELETPDLQGPMPEKARQVRARITTFCGPESKTAINLVCNYIDQMLGGSGKGSLTGYLSFFPYQTSHKVMRQFAQMIKTGEFKMYDHGEEENKRRYGTSSAPFYKVANIRSESLVLISSRTDSLSVPEDVGQFRKELTVPIYRDIFIDRDFNHFDLITHNDARYLVFAPILDILEVFERRDGVCKHDLSSSYKDLLDSANLLGSN